MRFVTVLAALVSTACAVPYGVPHQKRDVVVKVKTAIAYTTKHVVVTANAPEPSSAPDFKSLNPMRGGSDDDYEHRHRQHRGFHDRQPAGQDFQQDSESEPESKPQSMYEPEPESEPESMSEPEPESEPQSMSESESESEPKSEPEQTPTSSGNSSLNEHNQVALDMHNSMRAKHGAQPLVWDSKCESLAKKWADHLATTTCKQIEHPDKSQYPEFADQGQNLFMGMNTNGEYDDKGHCYKTGIQGWYDEVSDYTSPTFSSATGHFTQIVWKSTTKLGCAVSYYNCDSNSAVVVCQYEEPGNMMGAFEENVQV